MRSTEAKSARTGASATIVGALALWLLALAATGVGLSIFMREAAADPSVRASPDALAGLVADVVLATVGVLAVTRGLAVAYGWLLLAYGAISGVISCAASYAQVAWYEGLPAASAAVWVQDLFPLAAALLLLLIPALFPDGSPATARWGRAVRITSIVWAAYLLLFAFLERDAENVFLNTSSPPANPLGVIVLPDPVREPVLGLVWLSLVVTSVVIAVGSLVTRWRRSRGDDRRQVAWVAFAFTCALVVFALVQIDGALRHGARVDLGIETALSWLLAAATVGLAVAWGIAVLRFRLHAVDAVITRTTVYGLLSVAIGLVYVVVVLGVGALVPAEQPALVLLATIVVAVVVTPLRAWLQRGVERVMYGLRDDPYLVLAQVGREIRERGASRDVLTALARTIAEALKVPGVAIELERGGELRDWAAHGEHPAGAEVATVPLIDRGDVVGRMRVLPRSPRDPLGARDLALLHDLAGPTASVATAVRLADDLQRARERLVLAREDERRRLRRDLHDGLGPTVAAQTLQLDAVRERLEALPTDPHGAAELLDVVKASNRDLIAEIRRMAHELRPAALDDLGLEGALASHAAQLDGSGLDVDVSCEPAPLPALPAAVEAAGYHIAREALTNVSRHAHASRCSVRIVSADGELTVEIVDDGRGMSGTGGGLGLRTMRERAHELGGTLDVTSEGGVHVSARLPLAATGPAGHVEAEEGQPERGDGVHEVSTARVASRARSVR